MAGARSGLALGDAEIAEMLAGQRVIVLATIGPTGLPHMAPMWYLPVEDGRIAMWTYTRSQKVSNLRRDPRATLLVEAGTSYDELRGVSLDCQVEMITDVDRIASIGERLTARYGDAVPSELDSVRMADVVRAQAGKRLGLVFTPTRARGWDHRRPAGRA